jgi:probable rRNA maturation factor
MPEQKKKPLVPSGKPGSTPHPGLRLQFSRATRRQLLPDKKRLQEILQRTWWEQHQPDAHVEVNFVDEETICLLHQNFLGDPSATDVITFDLGLTPEKIRLAALYICIGAAKRHAARYRVTLGAEVQRLIIHGILHLLGYNDHSPAQRRQMRRHENRILRLLACSP